MAKPSIAQGAAIDSLLAQIRTAPACCRHQAAWLTKAGVPCGHIHFKSERPNTLFVLEPSNAHRHRYLHVGTDQKRQRTLIGALARWAARDRLQPNIADLEVQVSSLYRCVQTVHRHAQALREDHEAGGHR